MSKRRGLALLIGTVLIMVGCADDAIEMEESGQEEVSEDEEETNDDESTVLEDGGINEEKAAIEGDM